MFEQSDRRPEVRCAVVIQQSDSVGPAPGAMFHLRDDFLDTAAHLIHEFEVRLRNVRERRALVRVHGHAVLDVHSQLRHFLGYLNHMVVVDSRDYDGVDFDDNATSFQRRYRFELPLQQQFAASTPL